MIADDAVLSKTLNCGLNPLCEYILKSGDNGRHFAVRNGSNNDGMGCIVVCNEDVLLVFE